MTTLEILHAARKLIERRGAAAFDRAIALAEKEERTCDSRNPARGRKLIEKPEAWTQVCIAGDINAQPAGHHWSGDPLSDGATCGALLAPSCALLDLIPSILQFYTKPSFRLLAEAVGINPYVS